MIDQTKLQPATPTAWNTGPDMTFMATLPGGRNLYISPETGAAWVETANDAGVRVLERAESIEDVASAYPWVWRAADPIAVVLLERLDEVFILYEWVDSEPGGSRLLYGHFRGKDALKAHRDTACLAPESFLVSCPQKEIEQ